MSPLRLALPLLISACGSSAPNAPSVLPAPVPVPAPLPTPEMGAKDALSCGGAVAGIKLQTATVLALQAALKSGQISSERLVQQSLDRIAAFDRSGPALNAIRALAPDALDQARAADARRKRGEAALSALDGLPILLKDNVGTRDMPTTAGSIALAANIPKVEATITQKLRAAGAIVIGKTNLSEFANWVSLNMPNGYSSLGGQVIAAYDYAADPLGSSTGSGVASTMAFATAAIGSETSGSIISPSIVHSLVGLKPTIGLVSRAGVIPLAHVYDTAGPMARTVTDAAALLGVVAGVDPLDDASPRFTAALGGVVPDYLAALKTTALQGVRLGVRDLDNTTTGSFGEALEVLRAQGAEIIEYTEGDTANLTLLSLATITNEFKWYLNGYLANEAGPGLPVASLSDIIVFNAQNMDTVKYGQDLLIASNAMTGTAVDPVYLASRTASVTGAQLALDTAINDNQLDAIVAPGSGNIAVTASAGYPNITVPMGYVGQSPEGLSFAGAPFTEAKLLSYAYAYEQATRKRIPPTVLNPALAAYCAEIGAD
ncbi:MAG: amidase family protein [Pseudomonadota bacterium]